jgi:hypothetical protein
MKMKRISIDNGHSFSEPEQVIAAIMDPENPITFSSVAALMDPEIMEKAHSEFCDTDLHFLEQYLYYAEHDLIVG